MSLSATVPTPARTAVWAGIVFLVAGTATLLAVGSTGEPSPFTPAVALIQLSPVLPLAGLPVILALVALVRRDRRWLVSAIVLAVLAVPVTFLASLVAASAWLFAALRMPRAPENPSALVHLMVPMLAIVAVLAPLTHADPLCWTFTTTPDGERTYTPESVDGRYASGWGAPTFFSEGTESTGAVEVGPGADDAEPTGGETCRSDHTTPLQGATTLALTAVCAAMALRPMRVPEDQTNKASTE